MRSYAVRMRGGRPGGGKGPLVQEEVSGTLATGNDQTIFCLADAAANAAVDVDLSGTLKSNNDRNQPVVAFAASQRGELRLQGGDGAVTDAIPASTSGKQVNGICQYGDSAVRRLTPGECELLQGFPKGWTRIAWKGKPPKDCPDGARYKAIGNSMCVNVMRWLGERIEEVSSW